MASVRTSSPLHPPAAIHTRINRTLYCSGSPDLLPFSQRRANMPKFVMEREIPGAGNLTDAEIQEISRKSVSVLKGMGPEIQWLQSYVTGDKVYCVYLAPDEAAIREHARRG